MASRTMFVGGSFGALVAVGACTLTTSLDGLSSDSALDREGGAPLLEAGALADAADAAIESSTAQEAGGGAYRAAVLADSPLAYFRFEDTTAVAKDETGAHDGTYKGVATHVPGAIASEPGAKAAFFDGASWVDVGNVLSFSANAPFTIEAWASPVAGATDPMCMVAKTFAPGGATGSVQDGYTFYAEQGTNVLRLSRFVNSAATGPAGPGIVNDRFTHVVARYDGTKGAIFVDGSNVVDELSTEQLATITSPLTIGAGRGGVYCYFRGALDEVAIYGTALADARISAHYAAGTAK